MGGLAMATPLVAGVAGLAAFGAMVAYRAAFRHALKKAREEIDKMLLALQQQLDSQALFGDLPAPRALPAAGDDAALAAAMITTIL